MESPETPVDPVAPVEVAGTGERPSIAFVPSDPARRAVLESAAEACGTAWSEQCRAELRSERRAAAGGWPGTLSEARARVSASVPVELGRRALTPLTQEEREWATRTAYAAARKDWLRHHERDEDEE